MILYDIAKQRSVYEKAINAKAGGTPVRNYLANAVNNDGKVMLLGVYVDAPEKYFHTYTLLDEKGDVHRSDILGQAAEKREVKLMDDGSFVLRSRIVK